MKKIAIVTGASSGLGRAYAETILSTRKDLDEVWIIARRTERLLAIKEKFARARPLTMDLTNLDSFAELKSLLETEKPEVRILVNCAGSAANGSFANTSEKQILSIIDVNIIGVTMMLKTVVPFMSRGSFAIDVSSITGLIPTANLTVYSASKSYVQFITRGLREEYRQKGINFLSVHPGNMDTEMNRKDNPNHSKIVKMLPYTPVSKVVKVSLRRAAHGKAMYTPGAFYKYFRFLTKVLPWSLLIPVFKVNG